MTFSLLFGSLAVAGLVAGAGVAPANAQTYLHFAKGDHRPFYDARGNDLNGPPFRERCDGMSYGTGARSCGTATGGPVGGLSSRN